MPSAGPCGSTSRRRRYGPVVKKPRRVHTISNGVLPAVPDNSHRPRCVSRHPPAPRTPQPLNPGRLTGRLRTIRFSCQALAPAVSASPSVCPPLPREPATARGGASAVARGNPSSGVASVARIRTSPRACSGPGGGSGPDACGSRGHAQRARAPPPADWPVGSGEGPLRARSSDARAGTGSGAQRHRADCEQSRARVTGHFAKANNQRVQAAGATHRSLSFRLHSSSTRTARSSGKP